MKKEWKMNLQLFAENGAQTLANAQSIISTQALTSDQPIISTLALTNTQPPEDKKTYTMEEVAKLIQSEADKRVTQALAKQKKEYEKKLSLTGLSEQERAIAEKDQRITDMEAELQELRLMKTRQEVGQELAKRGLSAELALLIDLSGDETAIKERLDTFERAYKASVENDVKSRLTSGSAPARGTGTNAITREAFVRMSLAQQQELYRTDPDTYNRMTK